MKHIISVILLGFAISACAQSYDVRLIPDSLLKNSRAVLREEEFDLEIKSPGRAVTKQHLVYTILNASGDDYGDYVTFYDKFNSINSVTGVLYDENGKEIRRIKKKDMEDASYTNDGSLADDARYKKYNFYCRNYPYTVDFSEEDDYGGILYFEGWHPFHGPGVAAQHSKYVIIAPRDYQVRYRPVNCDWQPEITESGDKKIYTWEANNLCPRETEVSGPSWNEIVPYVMMAPSDFEADGLKGNMSSWENFGKFINQLRVGRDVLPDDIKAKVHQLTDNLSDTRQKIYALYNFLQSNTHYISIQLGIGGWQPFPASYVATKRYGDCKALSNYMVALLKEAGITGKYVEIYGGANPPKMIDDFSCHQANHAIVCVPMEKEKDTIWLECTSQTVSPDFMGSFTGNREALLIDEQGGHIVRTPNYSASDNIRSRVIDGGINDQGDLDAAVNTSYSGVREEMPHDLMAEMSEEQRQKYLNDLFNLPTYKVDQSHYEEKKGTIPVVREYLHVVSPAYATISGKRLFIVPNLFDKSTLRLPADSVRQYDIVYKKSFTDIDSITIKIPAGYQSESLPENLNINEKFGSYSVKISVLPDKIVYYRRWEERADRFPPSEYTALVKFYEKIYKADRSRIVLVKKE